MIAISRAADVLSRGGVIAYPTEGVYGLGCLPNNPLAVFHLLNIKQRDSGKGLILIASRAGQFADWVEPPGERSLPDPDPAHPVTWIVPAAAGASPLVTGSRGTIAVRLTTNPVARALCEAVDSPLVSTSANLSGQATARNRYVLRRQFARLVDYIVPGDCGPATGPSEIRELASGKILRAHGS